MSYFNEPARLAILNIQKKLDTNVEKQSSDSKGLLSRINPMSKKPNNVNKSELDKIYSNNKNLTDKPIFIDFYADW